MRVGMKLRYPKLNIAYGGFCIGPRRCWHKEDGDQDPPNSVWYLGSVCVAYNNYQGELT